MIKRFIDDHAIERIDTIKRKLESDVVRQLQIDGGLKQKFDALGWLARSVELVSPYLVQEMLHSFKRVVSQPEQRHEREMFIKSYHGSTAISITIRRLEQVLQQEAIEELNDGSM